MNVNVAHLFPCSPLSKVNEFRKKNRYTDSSGVSVNFQHSAQGSAEPVYCREAGARSRDTPRGPSHLRI